MTEEKRKRLVASLGRSREALALFESMQFPSATLEKLNDSVLLFKTSWGAIRSGLSHAMAAMFDAQRELEGVEIDQKVTDLQVGAQVRYVCRDMNQPGGAPGYEVMLAIVTKEESPGSSVIDLIVLPSKGRGAFPVQDVRWAPPRLTNPGTWHWPEKK